MLLAVCELQFPLAPFAKASQDPGKCFSHKSVLTAATHLFYIVSCFCTSFNEHYIQLFGFPFSFLNGHLSGEENTELEGKTPKPGQVP